MAALEDKKQDNFDLRTIYNELNEVKWRWSKIGRQLGIPYHKLKEFEEEKDSLAAVIDYGLRGNIEGSTFTWKLIVGALYRIKESGLARRIEQKYCQEEGKKSNEDDTVSAYQESSKASSTISSGSSSFQLPTVDMEQYFPHLRGRDDDNKMSDERLSQFRVELDAQTLKIKRAFASLVFDLQKHIENKGTFADLASLLTSLEGKAFVTGCSNTRELFDRLSDFISFFDFDTITDVTKKLGSDFNKKKLERYKKMFKQFSKQRVCEYPSDAFGDVEKSETLLFIKTDKHIRRLTGEEVKIFKYKLCKALKLQSRLIRIDDGCVKLSLRVRNINDLIITSEQKQLFSEWGILSISYGQKDLFVAESIEYNKKSEHKEDSGFVSRDTHSKESRSLKKEGKDSAYQASDAKKPGSDRIIIIGDDPAEELLESAKPINISSSADLHNIIQSGNIEALKSAIQNGQYNPLDKDVFNFNALHTATKYGRIEMLKYLVEDLMCNPSLPGDRGETPLHIAANFGQLKIVEYLVSEKNVDPDTKDNAGYLPAHRACSSNHMETMKYLITATCEYMEIKDLLTDFTNDGVALIHMAAINGNLNILKILIEEYNCDPNLRTKEGCTPVYEAATKGFLDVIDYLVRSCKCDPCVANHRNSTPLHVASRHGHLAIVKYLLKIGANASPRDDSLTTPLHEAALAGELEVVKFLIEDYKCDPKIADKNGYQCLHLASKSGYVELVKYLIEKQHMNPTQMVEKSKTTSLHIAASKGEVLVVEYLSNLESMKKFLFSEDDNELTPLHLAAQNNHVVTLKCFIQQHNLLPDLQTTKGLTPLMIAEKDPSKNCDAINYLKARFRGDNPAGIDHLQYVIKMTGVLSIVKDVAIRYKNCDVPNTYGQTALHTASEGGLLDVVKYLIEERNCNPHRKDSAGNTSLHMAAESGNVKLVAYLIKKHHCDPTATTYSGSNFDSNVFWSIAARNHSPARCC